MSWFRTRHSPEPGPDKAAKPTIVDVYVIGGPMDRKKVRAEVLENDAIVHGIPNDGSYRFVSWGGMCGHIGILCYYSVNSDSLLRYLLEEYCNQQRKKGECDGDSA